MKGGLQPQPPSQARVGDARKAAMAMSRASAKAKQDAKPPAAGGAGSSSRAPEGTKLPPVSPRYESQPPGHMDSLMG